MDLGIADKTALVCASTSGLGAATGEALAAEGCRVVFSGRRVELAQELAGRYPGSVGLGADLSTVDGALRLHAAAPLRQVHRGAPPFLLVHGTEDRVVPFSQSEALRDAFTAAGVPVRLVPVDGADHIFGGSAEVDAVVDLSVRYLAEALTPAS